MVNVVLLLPFCSSVMAGRRADLLFRIPVNEERNYIFMALISGSGVTRYAADTYSYQHCGAGWLKSAANLCLPSRSVRIHCKSTDKNK